MTLSFEGTPTGLKIFYQELGDQEHQVRLNKIPTLKKS